MQSIHKEYAYLKNFNILAYLNTEIGIQLIYHKKFANLHDQEGN